jgi:ABC-type antimicrobial peptide transport system permease subunit
MILGGTAVGAFIAMWGARFSESLLYGVYGIDPMTLIGAELVLFIVGALACWIPARRAMKMSPLDALRAS